MAAAREARRGEPWWSNFLLGRLVLGLVVKLLHKTLPAWSLFLTWGFAGAIIVSMLPARPDWLMALLTLLAAAPVYYYRGPIQAGFRKAMKPIEWIIFNVGMIAWVIAYLFVCFWILVKIAHWLLD